MPAFKAVTHAPVCRVLHQHHNHLANFHITHLARSPELGLPTQPWPSQPLNRNHCSTASTHYCKPSPPPPTSYYPLPSPSTLLTPSHSGKPRRRPNRPGTATPPRRASRPLKMPRIRKRTRNCDCQPRMTESQKRLLEIDHLLASSVVDVQSLAVRTQARVFPAGFRRRYRIRRAAGREFRVVGESAWVNLPS
jgi:hypothetical protein